MSCSPKNQKCRGLRDSAPEGKNAIGHASAVRATNSYLPIDLDSDVVIDRITVVADNAASTDAEAAQWVRVENGQLGEVEVWAWVGSVLTHVAAGKVVTSSALSAASCNATDGDTAINSDTAGWLLIRCRLRCREPP